MTATATKTRKARTRRPTPAGPSVSVAAAPPLAPLLGYQKRAVELEAQFTWNNWSRQTGKSHGFSLRRILRGMKRNRNQILLSAGERQSRELMSKVRLHLTAIRAAVDAATEDLPDSQFEGTKFGQLETRVRHRNGAFDFRIIALPANPLTARGYTGDLLLDEFGMHRDDREIWSAVYPIALRGNGEIDVCSTPKGRKNMFYRLRDNPLFATSTVTIVDAVADGLPVDIEQVRLGMADDELFAQEFMCEFLDEATAFLTFEMIAACEDQHLDPKWTEEAAETCEGEDLYVGVDIGRFKDLTVIWIWGRPRGTNILVTRAMIELPKLSFTAQEAILWPIIAMRNVRRTCMDCTGLGMQLSERAVDRFGAHRVEPVTFTMDSKNSMAIALRTKVEDRTVRIPVSPDIRNDWHSIERQVLPGGSVRYAADRGSGGTQGHADRFWAAALGVRAASSCGHVPWTFTPAALCQFAREGTW